MLGNALTAGIVAYLTIITPILSLVVKFMFNVLRDNKFS